MYISGTNWIRGGTGLVLALVLQSCGEILFAPSEEKTADDALWVIPGKYEYRLARTLTLQ